MKKKYIIGIVIVVILVILGIFLFNKKENNNGKELNMGYQIDIHSKEDTDGDGLSNEDETKNKTSPTLVDTDLDGLDDFYEIAESKTDPLKTDTDADGLTDYNEVVLGLNPLKSDTYDDGVKDSERENTTKIKHQNVVLTVSGTGNIADTYVNVDYNTPASLADGAYNKEFHFYSLGNIKNMIATFTLTDEEMQKIDVYDFEEVVVAEVNNDNYQDSRIILNASYDYNNHTLSFPIGNYQNNFYIIGDGKRLYYGESETPKKEKSDWRLVADSGFSMNKNAFSFRNYTTNYATSGNCYGMALFAGLYYKDALPLKADGKNYQPTLVGIKIPTLKKSYSYDLENSYFASKKDLRDFKIKTDVSKQFDLDKLQKNKTIPKEEIQMFNAIYQMFTMQKVIKLQYTGGYLGNMSDCVSFSYLSCKYDATISIDTLKQRIAAGEAPVIVINNLSHAVNGIRLYQYKYTNKYKLIIYDNNDPNNEREKIIECSNLSCITDSDYGNKSNIAFARDINEELKYF